MSHNNSKNRSQASSVEGSLSKALDNDLEKINEENAEAFAKMRLNALNAIPEKTQKKKSWPAYGAFAAAASIVLAVVLVFSPQQQSQEAKVFDDFELVLEEMELEEGDMELLENEIEFYLWLEENEKA